MAAKKPAPTEAPKKKSVRTRAQIVNDLLDDCKKATLIEIARECVMRDGDWAASIMNAFEQALAELDEKQKPETAPQG